MVCVWLVCVTYQSQTLTHIHSFDRVTQPDSPLPLFVSLPCRNSIKLLIKQLCSTHSYISVYPNKISQRIDRFDHPHVHDLQRKSCLFHNKNFLGFTSLSSDYSFWHLHSSDLTVTVSREELDQWAECVSDANVRNLVST